jgi:hypothetical protein
MSLQPCLKRQNDEKDEAQKRREHGVGPPSSPSTGKSKNVCMPYIDILHFSNKWR